jgi:hypothetical protein
MPTGNFVKECKAAALTGQSEPPGLVGIVPEHLPFLPASNPRTSQNVAIPSQQIDTGGTMPTLTFELIRENPWDVVAHALPTPCRSFLHALASLAADYCCKGEYLLRHAHRALSTPTTLANLSSVISTTRTAARSGTDENHEAGTYILKIAEVVNDKRLA